MSQNDLLDLFYQECINGQTDGYEVMQAVEEFIKLRPEVLISYCDDHNHAMAMIVLVPHEDDKEFWGTTFFYIPQCAAEHIVHGYFYPNNLVPLIDALRYHQRKSEKKPYGPFARLKGKKTLFRGHVIEVEGETVYAMVNSSMDDYNGEWEIPLSLIPDSERTLLEPGTYLDFVFDKSGAFDIKIVQEFWTEEELTKAKQWAQKMVEELG